jgi:NAD(P)-dependent dehydrogenase (short-subunit alcohol dehydrogenase family)
MNFGLNEKVALVTGSSTGMGKAVALLFGREGAQVAVTFFSHREQAQGVVDEIRRSGSDAIAVALDLASIESIDAAVRSIIERWGHVDILVNNAVYWGDRSPWDMPLFEELRLEEWRAFLRTNIEGHYAAIQSVLPSMRARSWGRIVNVSSGIAADGLPGAGPYGAAKAALHGLTRTLCKELGPAGILVNVVMPGLTLTERNATMIPDATRDKVAQASPIRRLLTPEEVAPLIVYLCSTANTAVTGEIIRASGGIM